MHEALIPPLEKSHDDFDRAEVPWLVEWDVIKGLESLGHQVISVGVLSDLEVIKDAIDKYDPQVIFNLLEEFDGETLFDQNVVSFLELLRVPYTGCNPRGLMLARDKALAKKVLLFHQIKTPNFQVFPKNKITKMNKDITFPLIVKCLAEEASLAISKASVVHNENKLLERVQYIHTKIGVDAIVEEFVEGREFYVGIIGNEKIKAFPVWELKFEKVDRPEKEFYSNRAKWNNKYRHKKGIKTTHAELTPEKEKEFYKICKEAYKQLNLNGYARVDLRMDKDGHIFIIEVNPNPDISAFDDFASSARFKGMKYDKLLSEILSLAKSWHK
jgi:D-alanine-D-alanine ligase